MKFRPPVNGSFSVNISPLGDKRIADVAGYYFVTGEAEGDLHAPIAGKTVQPYQTERPPLVRYKQAVGRRARQA